MLNYLPEEIPAEDPPPPPPPPEVKKQQVIPPPDIDIPKLDDLAYDLLKEKPEEQHSSAQKIEKVEPNGAAPEPTAGMPGSDKPTVDESTSGELNEEWNRLLSIQPSGKPSTVQQPQQDMNRYSSHRNINTALTDPATPAGGLGGNNSFANIGISSDYITSPGGNPDIQLPGSAGGGGISGTKYFGRTRYAPDNGNGKGGRPGAGNGTGPGGPNNNFTPPGTTDSGPTPGGSLGGPGGDGYRNSEGYPGGNSLYNIWGAIFGNGDANRPVNGGTGLNDIGNGSAGTGNKDDSPGQAPQGNGTLSIGRRTPPSGTGGDGIPGSTPGAPKIIKWTDPYPSEAYNNNVQGDIGVAVTFDTRGKPLKSALYSWSNEKGETDIRVNRLLGQAVRDKVMKEVLQPKEIPTFAGEPMERTIYYRFQFRINW